MQPHRLRTMVRAAQLCSRLALIKSRPGWESARAKRHPRPTAGAIELQTSFALIRWRRLRPCLPTIKVWQGPRHAQPCYPSALPSPPRCQPKPVRNARRWLSIFCGKGRTKKFSKKETEIAFRRSFVLAAINVITAIGKTPRMSSDDVTAAMANLHATEAAASEGAPEGIVAADHAAADPPPNTDLICQACQVPVAAGQTVTRCAEGCLLWVRCQSCVGDAAAAGTTDHACATYTGL